MGIKDDLARLGHDVAADIGNTYQRVHMQHTGWLLPPGQSHDPAASQDGHEPERKDEPVPAVPKPEREPDKGMDFDK